MISAYPRGLTERGSILFLILLAVVLFAALSYAVIGSIRGSGGDMDRESTSAAASEIIQYATSLEQAVIRLKTIKGCEDDEISYENSSYPTSTANPRAPADFSCHLFRPEGGGMTYRVWPEKYLEPSDPAHAWHIYRSHNSFSGTHQLEGVGLEDHSDVLLIIPWLSDAVCSAINDILGTSTGSSGFWLLHHLGPYAIRAPGAGAARGPDRTVCRYYSVSGIQINTFGHVLTAR